MSRRSVSETPTMAEINVSVLLVVLIACALGFVYMWLLWLFADMTNH